MEREYDKLHKIEKPFVLFSGSDEVQTPRDPFGSSIYFNISIAYIYYLLLNVDLDANSEKECLSHYRKTFITTKQYKLAFPGGYSNGIIAVFRALTRLRSIMF